MELISEDEKELLLKLCGSNYLSSHRNLLDKLMYNCLDNPIQLKHNNIEIRKSCIHGNGVFATSDIPTGSIITFYPVHGFFISGNLCIIKQSSFFTEYDWSVYQHEIDNNLSIIGDPTQIENKLLLGHMFNDAIGNTFTSLTEEGITNGINEYYEQLYKNNCFVRINNQFGVVYIITSKDVKQDEELTISYQPTYWIGRYKNHVQI